MTPAANQLFEFLLADMESSASTAYATAILTAAKAQITAGAGSLLMLTSTSANGKSFSGAGTLTALDTAAAARRALDEYADDAPVQFTNPSFANTFIQP